MITNSHIVDIKGEVEIEYFDGTTDTANLYSNSVELDIALLKVNNIRSKALVFGSSKKLEITNNVLSVGYSYNFLGEASVSKGTLSARRMIDAVTYLQSDISMNIGCSGGPLFNDLGEVVGINTYSTNTGNMGLSLSSESIELVLNLLINEPKINYISGERPSNSISKVLINIGYIDSENVDLFEQNNIIEGNKEIIQEQQKEIIQNQTKKDDSRVDIKKYYCDDNYSLVGQKCIGKEIYKATKVNSNCKEGYTLVDSNKMTCQKQEQKPIQELKGCTSGILDGEKCVSETTDICGFSEQDRYGSCPKGKECFEFSARDITILDEISCPKDSTKISTGDYVWNGELVTEENKKNWTSVIYNDGYKPYKDADNLTYYIYNSAQTYHCSKSYDTNTNIYTVYTFDELKESACSNGQLIIGYKGTTPSGFYCKSTIKTHWYVYDVQCSNPEYVYSIINGSGQCRKTITKYTDPYTVSTCPSGFQLENQKCIKYDSYQLEEKWTCPNNDSLDGSNCVKIVIKEAKTTN